MKEWMEWCYGGRKWRKEQAWRRKKGMPRQDSKGKKRRFWRVRLGRRLLLLGEQQLWRERAWRKLLSTPRPWVQKGVWVVVQRRLHQRRAPLWIRKDYPL